MLVSVIIPTTASPSRVPLLKSALDMLGRQVGASALPIVVVNGDAFDHEFVRCLKSDPRIRYLYREEGCAPRAVAAGRATVDTEFFGTLDDDDVYLPNAASVRASVLRSDPSIDAVITNGYDRTTQGDILRQLDLMRVKTDPASALMEFNWMHAAAAFYRTNTVGAEVFADAPPLVEWTYIGLRLALTRRLCFVETPTFAVGLETPNSLSKSRRYMLEQPAAIKKIMTLDAPPHIRRQLQRKYASALHEVATRYEQEHKIRAAWRAHWTTISARSGLRYATYTRHLLVASLGLKTRTVVGRADSKPGIAKRKA